MHSSLGYLLENVFEKQCLDQLPTLSLLAAWLMGGITNHSLSSVVVFEPRIDTSQQMYQDEPFHSHAMQKVRSGLDHLDLA